MQLRAATTLGALKRLGRLLCCVALVACTTTGLGEWSYNSDNRLDAVPIPNNSVLESPDELRGLNELKSRGTTEYVPAVDDSAEPSEKQLTVPAKTTQRFFDRHPSFLPDMERKCGITLVSNPATGGDSTGSPNTDKAIFTLRGDRISVEKCRAKIMTKLVAAEMDRITGNDNSRLGDGSSFRVRIPDDSWTLAKIDKNKLIEKLSRTTGDGALVSEEPDPEDQTATIITIFGKDYGYTDMVYIPLREELAAGIAATLHSNTPDAWQVVTMWVRMDSVLFLLSDGDSTIKALVDRTGCLIRLFQSRAATIPARGTVVITGPVDAAREVEQEIRTLINDAESRMPHKPEFDFLQRYRDELEELELVGHRDQHVVQ